MSDNQPHRLPPCPYCGGETAENPASPYPYCPECFRYVVPDSRLREREQREDDAIAAGAAPPLGIKLVCSLWTVGAFVAIGLGVLLLQAALEVESGLHVGLGTLQILLGTLQLASVYGLWTLRLWGWRIAIGLLWVGLVSAVLLYFLGNPLGIYATVASIAFLVFFYRRRELYR
jgi:hypothetical protein